MICSWLWGSGEGKGGVGRFWVGGVDREVGRGEMCKFGQARFKAVQYPLIQYEQCI